MTRAITPKLNFQRRRDRELLLVSNVILRFAVAAEGRKRRECRVVNGFARAAEQAGSRVVFAQDQMSISFATLQGMNKALRMR